MHLICGVCDLYWGKMTPGKVSAYQCVVVSPLKPVHNTELFSGSKWFFNILFTVTNNNGKTKYKPITERDLRTPTARMSTFGAASAVPLYGPQTGYHFGWLSWKAVMSVSSIKWIAAFALGLVFACCGEKAQKWGSCYPLPHLRSTSSSSGKSSFKSIAFKHQICHRDPWMCMEMTGWDCLISAPICPLQKVD